MERRKFLSLGAAAAGIAASGLPALATPGTLVQKEKRYQKGISPWPVCLDTATIRPASLKDKVKIAAKAGYDALEPWDGELQKFEAEGGNLKATGFKGCVSLEMYNPTYWKENLQTVAETGLRKTLAVLRKAGV